MKRGEIMVQGMMDEVLSVDLIPTVYKHNFV